MFATFTSAILRPVPAICLAANGMRALPTSAGIVALRGTIIAVTPRAEPRPLSAIDAIHLTPRPGKDSTAASDLVL